MERPRLRGVRGLKNLRAEWLVALLTLFLAINLLSAIWRKSITIDETLNIPAGYYHLHRADFFFIPEHPPLAKMWAALPLLALRPNLAPDKANPYSTLAEFWDANPERFELLSRWARVPMAVLTVMLAWLIFFFAAALFGKTAGVFATALFCLEPTVLAHGRIAQTDMAAALGLLFFAFALHRYWRAPTLARALLSGLSLALAVGAKFSLVIVLPLCALGALVLFVRPPHPLTRRRVAGHFAAALLVALVAINGVYFFQRPPIPAHDLKWMRTKDPEHVEVATRLIETLRPLLPTSLTAGLYSVWIHNRGGHAASLLGQYSMHGWWYYFPVAFALKTSLPFLLLAVAGLAWGLWRWLGRREHMLVFLLVPLGTFALFACSAKINIGIRHFLPAYPFLFILAGALLAALWQAGRGRRLGRAAALALVGLMLLEAVRIYPDYIPYMNQLRGRHEPWELLSDSNVEWGDDVRELARYLKKRKIKRVYTALSTGGHILKFYGPRGIEVGTPDPSARLIALGAGHLNGSAVSAMLEDVDRYAPYRDQEPIAVIGGSIFLFEMP